MIVDNFEVIRNLLSFKSEGDFYSLQILKRREDNPFMEINSRVIKNYYISSLEEFNTLEEEIKLMCSTFNARAYINPAVKNQERVAFAMIKRIADCVYSKQYDCIKGIYQSECDRSKSDKPIWVIDVDTDSEKTLSELITAVEGCQSGHAITTAEIIPTINGCHVLTYPFNSKELEPFLATCDDVELKKERQTLLYYSN